MLLTLTIAAILAATCAEESPVNGITISLVDRSMGKLKIAHFDDIIISNTRTKWRTVDRDVVDVEINAKGILWAAKKKRLYRMDLAVDTKPVQQKVVPSLDLEEELKVISVATDETYWTLSTKNIINSNFTGSWNIVDLGVNSGIFSSPGGTTQCVNLNDISISEDDTVWVACDEATARISRISEDHMSWGITYQHSAEYVASINKDAVAFSFRSFSGAYKMERKDFKRNRNAWGRRNSRDLTFYKGSIYKISEDGRKVISYKDMGKETLLTGEIELDFAATRISVGPNVPKPKVTVRNFTQPGKL